MGNIAGALESPRFTTLPRPSHSDAIYLPNCSSDAFITLLDLSPYNKKKKRRTEFLRSLLSPLDRDGGEGARGERRRNAVLSHVGVGFARQERVLGEALFWGPCLGREVGVGPAPGRHPLPSWEKLHLSPTRSPCPGTWILLSAPPG